MFNVPLSDTVEGVEEVDVVLVCVFDVVVVGLVIGDELVVLVVGVDVVEEFVLSEASYAYAPTAATTIITITMATTIVVPIPLLELEDILFNIDTP
jgi:hypothetical protein